MAMTTTQATTAEPALPELIASPHQLPSVPRNLEGSLKSLFATQFRRNSSSRQRNISSVLRTPGNGPPQRRGPDPDHVRQRATGTGSGSGFTAGKVKL